MKETAMPSARALIIDDNPSNILVLEQLLGIEDISSMRLSATADLAEQLDAIQKVEVVFLDLEMPRINGYEAVKIIKSHPNFRTAKVVAYSVHVSELNTAMDMGFDSFLGKPLNAESFPDQLQRILRGERIHYIP
jgi:CheY-like chemotaxis protein